MLSSNVVGLKFQYHTFLFTVVAVDELRLAFFAVAIMLLEQCCILFDASHALLF